MADKIDVLAMMTLAANFSTDYSELERANMTRSELYGQLNEARAAVAELIGALKALSDMYGHAWDLVDGGLMMMGPSVPRFEKAHERAFAILTKVNP